MKKIVVAAATFVLGALSGFGLQTVIAQEQAGGASTWDIYHSPMEGGSNFYVVRLERETGMTWVATNGGDFKLISDD